METLSRGLVAELGPHGICVICLRPDAILETAPIDMVYSLHASGAGMPRDEFQALMEGMTLRQKFPTLPEVANVMTGTANLSGSSIVA